MNDYQRIARVNRYLDERHPAPPGLAALADYLGLSRFHFHRLLLIWTATTPRDFLQGLTLAHARKLLRQGENVLDDYHRGRICKHALVAWEECAPHSGAGTLA